MTRRLLPALLLAGSGLVAVGAVGAPATAACPARPETIQQQAMGADDVFTGTVESRREDGNRVLYAVTVGRVYKGDLDTAEATVRTAATTRGCGLPDLARGAGYVFFTDGTDLTTTAGSGTAAATAPRVARLKRLLGDGRPPVPPEPAKATFTTVAGKPTSLERVAAPGVALVIVGLLGLVLAAALGRRTA